MLWMRLTIWASAIFTTFSGCGFADCLENTRFASGFEVVAFNVAVATWEDVGLTPIEQPLLVLAGIRWHFNEDNNGDECGYHAQGPTQGCIFDCGPGLSQVVYNLHLSSVFHELGHLFARQQTGDYNLTKYPDGQYQLFHEGGMETEYQRLATHRLRCLYANSAIPLPEPPHAFGTPVGSCDE